MVALLQHLLMESAQRRPEATAVRLGDEALSYGELDRLSNQMAHVLGQQGVRPGDRVAIYSPKAPGSLVAIHAILKAGGVYVPLDPNAPAQRLAYILQNCGVRCMVASGGNAAAIRKIAEQGMTLDAVVFSDAAGGSDLSGLGTRSVSWAEVTGSAEKAPPANASNASDLAYILYTSGSTGTPKGVMFAGEVFPIKYLGGVMRAIPGAKFANLYGPTETNVITFYRVPSIPGENSEPIPIGRACSNTEISIVDESGQPVREQGAAGELHARGATVAQGYWGDPARTAATFLEGPSPAAERVYRTGDIVSLSADGNYRLLGRRDRMIKSRGYRIELDEIETVLQSHPAIKEAAVVTVPDELIGNRIQAFVAFSEALSPGAGMLRDYCLEKLPRYMVPESFEVLDELPKTSTGKVDRTRLARGGQ